MSRDTCEFFAQRMGTILEENENQLLKEVANL